MFLFLKDRKFWHSVSYSWFPFLLILMMLAGGANLLFAIFFERHIEVRLPRHDYSFVVMSTAAELSFWGDENECNKASNIARTIFREVETIANRFDRQSELSQLNATSAGEWFECSDKLWELLNISRHAFEESDGAFDITTLPLTELWRSCGRTNKLPSAEKLQETLALVGMKDIEWDNEGQRVRFLKPGISFDLGGVAKGFAVDWAYESILDNTDIRTGLINLGGNIKLLPIAPEAEGYRIGVTNPRNSKGDVAEVLFVEGGNALASSGPYERYVVIDNKQYGHILDPRSGFPARVIAGVSVIAPTAAEADWRGTAFFVDPDIESKLPPGTAVHIFGVTKSDDKTIGHWPDKTAGR